jgi:hypothetical protein
MSFGISQETQYDSESAKGNGGLFQPSHLPCTELNMGICSQQTEGNFHVKKVSRGYNSADIIGKNIYDLPKKAIFYPILLH